MDLPSTQKQPTSMNLVFKKFSLPSYDSVPNFLQEEYELQQGQVLVAVLSPKNEIYSSQRSALFLLSEADRESSTAKIARQCQQFAQEAVAEEPARVYLAAALLSTQQLEELLNSTELGGDALVLRDKLQSQVGESGWR
jgi:F0F1-type ATP synthase delta subunit